MIIQIPPSTRVATLAINWARNAALLAIIILSLVNSDIYKKLVEYMKKIHLKKS
jgi:phosphoribosylcarboxyaminoimidazole (NCAIR) mutase